jgi:hypothetical protein
MWASSSRGYRHRFDDCAYEVTKMSEIRIQFAERTAVREEVIAWEDGRIDAAAKKLGVAAPPPGSIESRREAFLTIKLELGQARIIERLSGDTRKAERIALLSAKLSRRHRFSTIDLHVSDGSAGAFVEWFDAATKVPDEEAMLRACPDHFAVRGGDRGNEILETTGASPFAMHIYLDDGDYSTLQTPIDPTFTHRIDGVARTSGGSPVGGTRHQFRDTEEGYQARLTVEFPALTPSFMVVGHRWHLACEFSNWAEAALA